jgi:hypothetical protein
MNHVGSDDGSAVQTDEPGRSRPEFGHLQTAASMNQAYTSNLQPNGIS